MAGFIGFLLGALLGSLAMYAYLNGIYSKLGGK